MLIRDARIATMVGVANEAHVRAAYPTEGAPRAQDEEIAALAGRQHGVGHRALRREAWWMAAVLAAGRAPRELREYVSRRRAELGD